MKIDSLTKEQEAQIKPTLKKWLGLRDNPKPLDFEKVREGTKWLYGLFEKPEPITLIARNPIEMQLLAKMAVAVLSKSGRDFRNQLWDQLEDRLKGQLAELRSQLRDQFRDKLGDQLWDQLKDQLWSQLWDQFRDHLRSQFGDHLKGQLWELEDQLGDQLRLQLGNQLRSQLEDHLWSQLRDQLRSQLGLQLGDQLKDQLWSQLWDQFRDQLRLQFGPQLGDQLRDQLGDHLWDQLRDQLRELEDHLRDQLRDHLRSQLWQKLWDQSDKNTYFPLSFFGNVMDAGWVSFYGFILDNLEVSCPEELKEKFSKMREYAENGILMSVQLEGLCVVCPMPSKTFCKNDGTLHCEDGAAVRFEGYEQYFLDGVRFEEELYWKIVNQELSLTEILKIGNVDQRAIAIQYSNPEKTIKDLEDKGQGTSGGKLRGKRSRRPDRRKKEKFEL